MSRGPPKNVAASVRQRLQNRARTEGQNSQVVLTHFAIERHRDLGSAVGRAERRLSSAPVQP